ncbi:hypothetical protein PUNSTDRAFT_129274 [Punctularia strigosozonata HHB-11173 SS5]|uniref:uncharacterized protein n=1 Tax=Punctularia strigosozonata (strain HHB-11173) TaxID=741275 RepID=UPI00044179F4|nr:uncharacterized protein PUNSTDRAFT_129274 [Punctularia strigosozonata HHB-11173 SS5]EIN13596.1 hypothetical protein PUNSTDRAFT_129274 [Punctularia strigosozonata HHB-11173 SS5]
MLDELIMDVVLQAHRETLRSRAVCHICHTKCGTVHVPGPSSVGTSSQARPPSRARSPSADSSGGPSNGKEGNIYLECLQCKRQIASNRYAPHLSACMGLGTGSRRAAPRNAATKVSSDAGRAESPYLGSETGNVSDESSVTTPKSKAKSKAKRKDDAEFNLHRKRPGSPQVSPPKKSRKAKAATAALPVVKSKNESERPGTPLNSLSGSQTNSQTKIPSRLRESSIANFAESQRERSSSPGSSSESDEEPPTATPVASQTQTTPNSFASFAAADSNGVGHLPAKRGRGRPRKVQPRPPSPPRPTAPIRAPEPDYLGEGGDETGSSTDTDSD